MSPACDASLDQGTQGTQSTAGVNGMLFDREHWNDMSSVLRDIDESQGMEQDLSTTGVSPMKPCHQRIEVCSCDAPGFYLASLTLMTESVESNQLTLIKPRSTWVITSTTEPTTPIDHLDQVNTSLWSTLGQRHSQTPLKPWRRWVSSGTFPRSPKFT
jgi:hypothetical protein